MFNLCIYIVDSEIQGYVCARKLSDNYFVLTKEENDSLCCVPDSYIITHLVVDDIYRKRGIGKELIKEVLNTIDHQYKIYALGWIKNDSNKWEAETIFKSLWFKQNLYILMSILLEKVIIVTYVNQPVVVVLLYTVNNFD